MEADMKRDRWHCVQTKASMVLLSLLLIIQFRTLAQGMILTCTASLPILINPVWKIPYRNAGGLLSK